MKKKYFLEDRCLLSDPNLDDIPQAHLEICINIKIDIQSQKKKKKQKRESRNTIVKENLPIETETKE